MSYSECQTQPHSNVSLFFLPSHLDGFMGVRRKGEVICDLEKLDGWRWQKVAEGACQSKCVRSKYIVVVETVALEISFLV